MAYVDYKNSIRALSRIEYLGSVASQSAMLALLDSEGNVPQLGDWCFRSDLSEYYIVTGNDATQIGSWTSQGGSASSVAWTAITGKPSTFAPSTHTHPQSEITNLVTDLAGKQASLPSGDSTKYLRGDLTMQTLDKSAVGLSNVDNTSDATKNSATVSLTNKTINGSLNTLSNIPQSAITNLTTDLGNKQATITGAATTIDTEDLTASRAVISNASGKIAVSTVTDTELGYVSGVTSAIQTQLGNKQNLDATLTALAAFNTNGILTQTAADTFTARSIAVDGAAYLTVSNGDGVSGNPTLNINTSTVETLGTNQTITGIKTFSTAPVLNALPTGTAVASAATASTLVARDENANIFAANLIEGYATTATAAGTTTLTISSNNIQYFTGSTTQTVVMPVTSTLTLGQSFWICNRSTGAVTVQSSGLNNIVIVAAGCTAELVCILTSGTTAASWDAQYFGDVYATGKKLTVNNTLTFSGTDSTTITFPSTSATMARTDAAQTFTGVQTFSSAPVISSITNTGTLTLPTATTTLVGTGTTDTLTNKTIALGSNTVSGTKAQFNTAVTDGDIMYLDSADTVTAVKTFSTAPAFNALPTGSAVASAATASTLVARDSNANVFADNFISSYTTTVTAAGTTTLTVDSTRQQRFSGSTTQTCVLPVTSTLQTGFEFEIINDSSGSVTVQSSGLNNIVVLTANQSAIFKCIGTSLTTAADWTYRVIRSVPYTAPTIGSTSIASGSTVTNISGLTLTDSQNTVSTPTTTSVGYLGTPVNSQSAAYTLVMSDAGKTILHPSTDANARTFTIPANSSVAYPIGTVLTFINETSQVVTIAITTDTMTLVNTTTTGSRSLAQNGIATAVKITSTKWIISGVGLT